MSLLNFNFNELCFIRILINTSIIIKHFGVLLDWDPPLVGVICQIYISKNKKFKQKQDVVWCIYPTFNHFVAFWAQFGLFWTQIHPIVLGQLFQATFPMWGNETRHPWWYVMHKWFQIVIQYIWIRLLIKLINFHID